MCYFFQFPFIDVGTWVFLEEQGSLSRSLASSSKPGSISNLACGSSSSHTLQKFSSLQPLPVSGLGIRCFFDHVYFISVFVLINGNLSCLRD